MNFRSAVRVLAVFAWAPASLATTIATQDLAEIAAFEADRTVLGFDEIDAGPGRLSYIELDPDYYAALGLRITSGDVDGGTKVTSCEGIEPLYAFGPPEYWSQPNVLGGGPDPFVTDYHAPIRVTFTGQPAIAVGAQNDFTGSNISLSAYRADGSLIETVAGDQGFYLGIVAADIAYAEFTWNSDQTVSGYTIDNLTFTLAEKLCRPDCNGDGKLNVNDFICFQSEWRKKSAYGDYNGDGKWNINDFIAFQASWRTGC